MVRDKFFKASKQASVTVEASLALSVFLFFCTCFLYLYTVLILEIKIQEALEETVQIQAEWTVAEQTGESDDSGISFLECTVDQAFAAGNVIRYVGSGYLKRSGIRGGAAGLDFSCSSFLTDGENIELVVSYRVKIPFFSLTDIRVVQCAKRRVWYGYDSSGKKNDDTVQKQTVYVTEKGSVYHLYADCSYIDITINGVESDNIENLRNKEGEIYYACEVCNPQKSGTVYITEYGNRYHSDPDCSEIERNVTKMDISEAAGRRVCSKCKARAGG